MEFTDEQIEFMRQDLASDMSLTKMIEATKQRLKEQGKDFDRELIKVKEKKAAHARVRETILKHKQTRGY
jgi:hypothetical protein